MWRTRLGSGGNLANFAGTLIEPGRKTLADLLHGEGYFTGLVGKWHQGIDWKLRDESAREVIRVHPNYQDFRNIDFTSPVLKGPNDYGFDYSFATAGSAEMNPSTFIENNRATLVSTPSPPRKQTKDTASGLAGMTTSLPKAAPWTAWSLPCPGRHASGGSAIPVKC